MSKKKYSNIENIYAMGFLSDLLNGGINFGD
jgi:hypothetical protein